MKNTLFILLVLFFVNTLATAQQAFPQGMQYQAVARNAEGQVLSNEAISIKIKLHSLSQEEDEAYIEQHDITTNKLGLFNLIIGEGEIIQGKFRSIPWSTEDIFIALYLKDQKTEQFIELNDSKLMAVPYAFHALTAGKLSNESEDHSRSGKVLPHEVWSTFGNGRTDDTIHRLGTIDDQDLVVISNNVERLRLGTDGNIQLFGNTIVAGDLDISGNVRLNTRGELTTVAGEFQVINNSNSKMTGNLNVNKKLTVDGVANFQNSINVRGHSNLNRELRVLGDGYFSSRVNIAGATDIKDKLTVSEGANTLLTGDLQVDGKSTLSGDLVVDGTTNFTADATFDGKVSIMDDLYVDGQTELNDNLTVTGESTLNNKLSVNAPTELNNGLSVIGATGLNAELTVAGKAMLIDDLTVAGKTILNDDLTVTEETTLEKKVLIMDDLSVDGNTELEDLTVNGKMTMTKELALSTDVADGGFVATFENKNAGNGDGLKIKLGKTHPRWDGGAEVTALVPYGALDAAVNETVTVFKNLLAGGTFDGDDFISIAGEIGSGIADWNSVGNALCEVTNDLIGEINDGINLPAGFSDIDIGVGILDALNDFSDVLIDDDWITDIEGDIVLPGIELPAIPTFNCPSPNSLNDFGLSNFRLLDVPNSLTSENKFIQFTDKDDRQLGAIEAQSIENWCVKFLNRSFFMDVFSSFAAVTDIGLDPTTIASTALKYGINGLSQWNKISFAYNKIGVSYSSGFGDYAEWLERADANEDINPGDIVGVIGGKISKDLRNAEQIMAVSTNPIVLGNKPSASNEYLGNKIAFMGQIPVKIMGPVETGDFIIAKGDIPGYGVAIHPDKMTLEDSQRVVGRAWEAKAGPGPKMVNTVVGMNNGNFQNVLRSFDKKIKQTDERLDKIEAQLNQLNPVAKN